MTGGNSDSLAIAEKFAAVLSSLSVGDLPDKAKEVAVNDLLDMAGLCIATRERIILPRLLGDARRKDTVPPSVMGARSMPPARR